MERFTYFDDGLWYGKLAGHEYGGFSLIDQLAAYENTGLTPEEIWALVPPPNAPITLNELLQMDGEPVWIVNTVSGRGNWALINIKESEVIGIDFEGFGLLELYGYRWIAYRRRPEEVQA